MTRPPRRRTLAARPDAPVDLPTPEHGMRNLQPLMVAADQMSTRLREMNVQDMSPDQLQRTLIEAAGGEDTLRRLMSGDAS